MWGHTPATCGQKGGSFCPLQRRGPVRPKNVLENTVCVLCMGCGRLASASELHLRQVGARGNACRARILPIPANGRKTRGVYPLWPFPYYCYFCYDTCSKGVVIVMRPCQKATRTVLVMHTYSRSSRESYHMYMTRGSVRLFVFLV